MAVRSITLASDMKHVYYINSSGVATKITLGGNGVLISSSGGEVDAIRAPVKLTNGSDECSIGTKAQWQVAYHKNTDIVVMVGNDDIESGLTADVKPYDLSNGKTVNLRFNSSKTKILIRT